MTKRWLLRDQWGRVHVIDARTARQAVLRAYAYGKPHIQRMWVDRKDGTSRHAGYVVGQGRGNQAAWVNVERVLPLDP